MDACPRYGICGWCLYPYDITWCLEVLSTSRLGLPEMGAGGKEAAKNETVVVELDALQHMQGRRE